MKHIIVSIAFILIYGACFSPTQAQSQKLEPGTPAALVTQADDAVVRRAGWSDFSRLSLGTSLEFGDLIDPKDGIVRVLCPDLSEKAITQIGPLPCPRERVILQVGEVALAGWQRGQTLDPTIPYLISPRATLILTDHPLIQWHPVDDADGYRINVRGEGVSWLKQVDGAATDSLQYPKDAPALKPGIPYSIQITALNQGVDVSSSAEEDTPGLTFNIMPSSDATNVQKTITVIRGSLKDKRLGDLAVALYETQNGLYADSVQLLSTLTGDLANTKTSASAVQTSPIPYTTLADLYLQSHLTPLAINTYQQALTLAQANGDTESQANALVGLARATVDKQQQTDFAKQALDIWQKLGAKDQVVAVQQEFDSVLSN